MILVIRTDKPEAEVGLYDGSRELGYETWQAHRQLSSTIHHKIQKLLDGQNITWQDISGVIIYKGPGSFTGIRIGISVANALADGLQIPVAGTTGPEWIKQGIELLKKDSQSSKYALPEYGAPVHTTKPRK